MDTFKADAFSMVSLTAAMNLLPYQPGKLGALGLFSPKPVRTDSIVVEERNSKLSLLLTSARGSVANPRSRGARNARNFTIPHVPQFSQIMADDVLNVRAFGSESELEAVSDLVNSELVEMRASHEVTQEFHRVKALDGVILDGDGTTTLVNLYTDFGLTQKEVSFDFGAGTQEMKTKSTEIIRNVEDGMGGSFFSGVGVICGNTYWDNFITHASVTTAYERWQDGSMLREQQRMIGGTGGEAPNWFPYGGLNWMNYRGSIGGTKFVADLEAFWFPLGTADDTFTEAIAPADFVEAVGTPGQRFYAAQEMMDFNKGVKLHTQSNTLPIVTRLDAIGKATDAT